MPRVRWWVLTALVLVTLTVVALDATGVIFEAKSAAPREDPLVFDQPAILNPSLTPVNVSAEAKLPPRVERSVAASLDDKKLGPRVSAIVVSASGEVLMSRKPKTLTTPASTLKLLTAVSVLDAFPMATRLETSVVEGVRPNQLVLVGGGDSTLSVEPAKHGRAEGASLSALAKATSKVVGDMPVTVGYDDSLFSGPAESPGWEPTYVSSGVIAPVTSLMADQGLVSDTGLARYPRPARAATNDFVALLEERGVVVRGEPVVETAPSQPVTVAAVESAPMGNLVERMLRDSDNQLAESLARLAALERGLPASFAGAAKSTAAAAAARDIQVSASDLYDASGLSRDDLVSSAALVGALEAAAMDADLRPLTTGLPVAGFDGTLSDRYLTPPQSEGAGFVRAKTGTLTGVSAEAGMVVACDGSLVFFAFMADRVPFDTEAARDALDEAAAALTRCG